MQPPLLKGLLILTSQWQDISNVIGYKFAKQQYHSLLLYWWINLAVFGIAESAQNS